MLLFSTTILDGKTFVKKSQNTNNFKVIFQVTLSLCLSASSVLLQSRSYQMSFLLLLFHLISYNCIFSFQHKSLRTTENLNDRQDWLNHSSTIQLFISNIGKRIYVSKRKELFNFIFLSLIQIYFSLENSILTRSTNFFLNLFLKIQEMFCFEIHNFIF